MKLPANSAASSMMAKRTAGLNESEFELWRAVLYSDRWQMSGAGLQWLQCKELERRACLPIKPVNERTNDARSAANVFNRLIPCSAFTLMKQRKKLLHSLIDCFPTHTTGVILICPNSYYSRLEL
jgi:hypothetical protein